MNGVSGTILFLILILGSLVLVSLINRVQNHNRMVRIKIGHLRRRLDEVEDIGSSVEPLLESLLIPKIINEELANLIDSIYQLDPKADWLEVKRQHVKAVIDKLSADQRTLPFYRIQDSDAAIARNKYYVIEAARIIRRHHALGRLSEMELESHIQELQWARLTLEVVSYVAQGHKAVNRNDATGAYGYYRKAQNLLMSNNSLDNRSHRFIREIGEILEGKRLAISRELMPEAEFNPKKKPDFDRAQPPPLPDDLGGNQYG